MDALLPKRERIQLCAAEVLLACGDADGLEVLSQMFAGFGVHTPRRCRSAAEALTIAGERELHLVIVDSQLTDGPGNNLVRAWRRELQAPNRYAPIITLLGHATPANILRARDAGASFVVRQPASPAVMMQRVLKLLDDDREFVVSDGYCGPDRRIRALGPPAGMKGRRHTDLNADLGEATTPNLDQNEIDALLQPVAVSR